MPEECALAILLHEPLRKDVDEGEPGQERGRLIRLDFDGERIDGRDIEADDRRVLTVRITPPARGEATKRASPT